MRSALLAFWLCCRVFAIHVEGVGWPPVAEGSRLGLRGDPAAACCALPKRFVRCCFCNRKLVPPRQGRLEWLRQEEVPRGEVVALDLGGHRRAKFFLEQRSGMDKFLVRGAPGFGARRPCTAPEADAAGEDVGKGARRDPSWRRIRAEGFSCDYKTLFRKAEADELFRELEKEVEYFEGDFTKLHIFGKWCNIPRKQVTYGDAGLTYSYSGVTFSPKPWIPVLNHIRDCVQLASGHTFNFVLINRYKDGLDHIGEHRDDEKELVPHSPIASVSFGACRDFVFRHRASRGRNPSRLIRPVTLQLEHGSLLLMNFPTNQYWYHSLPIRKKVMATRINLTFRNIRSL